MTNTRNERGGITIDSTYIGSIIKEYSSMPAKKMDQLHERHNLQKLTMKN